MNLDTQSPALEPPDTTIDTELWPVRILMVGMVAIAKGVDILSTIVGVEMGHYEANPALAAGFETIGIVETSFIGGLIAVSVVVIAVEWVTRYLQRKNISQFAIEGIRFSLYMIPTLVWLGVGLRNLQMVLESAELIF